MGRRPPKAAFIPDAYVFPGGRLDPGDRLVRPASALKRGSAGHAAAGDAGRARALAVAAIRETFEETGLLLGAPGAPGAVEGSAWSAMRAHGLAPALGALDYLGRAITPTDSPIRFHARFFLADTTHVQGTLGGGGELSDLHWVRLDRTRHLPIIDVTEFMLSEVARWLSARRRHKPGRPLFSYRNNVPVVRYL